MKGLIFVFLLFTSSLYARTVQISDSVKTHVVFKKSSNPVGDVLFLHGFGDRADNHKDLFDELNRNGLNVIAFDYPDHGETQTSFGSGLDATSFTELASMASKVLQKFDDKNLPNYIVGWSTGGLLAVRIAQVFQDDFPFGEIEKMVLLAPGVSVKKCVGNVFCHVTNETLTHDPDAFDRNIKPTSPFKKPLFSMKLLYNAHESRKDFMGIESLVFTAGEDEYVNTENVQRWIFDQNSRGAALTGVYCPTAYHELDNELKRHGGEQVRKSLVNYLLDKENFLTQGPCYQH